MKKFRYDINALRAIAVISVVFFHFKIPGFTGGFAGVDVFFVISGYLMSKIIISDIHLDKFSLLNFYKKRFTRIVPALVCLVFFVTLAGFFFYLPDEYKANEKNALSSLLFYSNILYWKASGYFDPAADNNIFLHTWSLSLEWQFYIIYPILLIAVNRVLKRKNYLLIFIGLLSFLLCVFSIYLTKISPVASFYLLPARAWEMLAGAVACLVETKAAFKKRWLSVSGYGLILLSVFFLESSLSWPGLFTLLPVAGTFLVIVSNSGDYIILKNKVIQFIGKISYSLYLWHWPIIVFAQYMGLHFTIICYGCLFLITLILAYSSYRFVELSKIKNIVAPVTASVFLMVITALLSHFNSNTKMFKTATIQIANYEQTHQDELLKQFSRGSCFFEDKRIKLTGFNQKICLNIDSTKKNILLLGDSHAAELSASFLAALDKKNINFLQASLAGRLPFLPRNNTGKYTNELFDYIFYDFIVKNKNKLNGVILSGDWVSAKTKEAVTAPLTEVIDYLKSEHLPVIIIGQGNIYTIPFSSIAAKSFEYERDFSNLYLDKKSLLMNDFLAKKFSPFYVDIFYRSETPGLNAGNVPYMFDKDHFTTYGADLVVQKIMTDSITARFLNE